MAADTLTAQELTDLRLGTLKTAVDDWKTMADRLEELATGGAGVSSAADLRTKAEAADWSGANATVSREFVTKTAKQFADAAAEAKSVLGLLRDAHSDFTAHKNDLRTAIDELAKQNIYVNDNGHVSSAAPPGAVAGNSKDIHAPSDDELTAAQSRVDKILREAGETDRIVARALRALAKDKYDFTEKGADSVKEADREQGKADAEYWKNQIAKGHVADWSEEKLARFNTMLEHQRDNSGFTENFATGLGAKGTLQFWRDLAAPGGGPVEGDRAKMLAHVQDNLSMSLANASHGGSPAMEQWKKDMVASGTKVFPVDPAVPLGPNGFQVMSSLMHKGKFDGKFLDDYGKAMVEYERDYPGEPKYAWRDNTTLDYPPGNNPVDPMSGFMDALGHNPEESLKFFDESTGKGDDRKTNFDYLAGHGDGSREWPAGTDGKPLGYGSLGHALESATLGYAYDDTDPHIPPMKTEAQIHAREERLDLLSTVMANYNEAEVIEKQPGVGDSLAKIAAGHIDSFNYSMADWGGSGELSGRDALYGADKNHLRDFGGPATQDFLRAVASDGDSYQTVSAAQQVYGTSLMAAQDDHHSTVNAGLHSVSMHGMLDEARMEAIGKEFADKEEERNRALEKQGEWRNFAVGAAVGVGVGVASEVIIPAGAAAAIAVPLAFETAGGAAETAMATNTIDWLHEKEYNNDQQSIESIEQARNKGQRDAMTPLLNYAAEHHMTPDEVTRMTREARSEYDGGRNQTDTDDSRGY